MEKKYLVHGWREKNYLLSAKEIYDRVMKNSEYDYNWFAPARELIKICKKRGFPTNYAIDIKIAILICFSNFEHVANCGGDYYPNDPEDDKAVQYCYNSLYEIKTEEVIKARKYYLSEMIKTASRVRFLSSLYHPGHTYQQLCSDWRKAKLDEYILQKEIDFNDLVKTLRNEFTELVKKAEENGDFEEDKKKDEENWKNFYQMLNKYD